MEIYKLITQCVINFNCFWEKLLEILLFCLIHIDSKLKIKFYYDFHILCDYSISNSLYILNSVIELFILQLSLLCSTGISKFVFMDSVSISPIIVDQLLSVLSTPTTNFYSIDLFDDEDMPVITPSVTGTTSDGLDVFNDGTILYPLPPNTVNSVSLGVLASSFNNLVNLLDQKYSCLQRDPVPFDSNFYTIRWVCCDALWTDVITAFHDAMLFTAEIYSDRSTTAQNLRLSVLRSFIYQIIFILASKFGIRYTDVYDVLRDFLNCERRRNALKDDGLNKIHLLLFHFRVDFSFKDLLRYTKNFNNF